jgi:uncharacterized protein YycO
MTTPVEFEIECPDCQHMTWAVANPGSPYDWDWQCECTKRRDKRKPRS